MNPITTKLAMCCTLVVGAGLWSDMAQKFDAEDKLSYEPNVACLKGSPYGKILALAMQGPIDFYWHKGTTHEDAEVLSDGHHHHDGEHAHDHGHAHDDGCDSAAHDDHATEPVVEQADPFHKRAKQQIKMMAASAHRRTDGKPISEAHEKYLQSVTENKLRLAYELDPSNYTNYGNYHLFIATTTFGKSEGDDDEAVALARKTLDFCKNDTTDPASWITAASAAYHMITHIGRYYERYTISEAKASLAEFDFCITHYVKLRQEALEAGRIVSPERVKEEEERVYYLTQLRKAQGIYMKRVMSTKMAKTESQPQKVH